MPRFLLGTSLKNLGNAKKMDFFFFLGGEQGDAGTPRANLNGSEWKIPVG